MAELHFSVASPETAFYDGKHKLKSDVATAYNGTMLEMNSDGELIVDTGAGAVRGMLYEFRQFVEFPTSDNVAADMAGKYVNYATGHFMAFVGKDFFAAGSFPTVGTKLYAGATTNAGKLVTSAVSGVTVPVGIMDGSTTIVDETGTAVTVAIVRFNFTPLSFVDAIV